MKQPSTHHQVLGGSLNMQDSCSSGHPLRCAVVDDAAATDGVSMFEDALKKVGDRLEAAVGVPRRALGFAGGVVHFAHLIHVDERVEGGNRDTGEGSLDRKALAFEARGGRGATQHGPAGRLWMRKFDSGKSE